MIRHPCALCNAVQIYTTNVYYEPLISSGSGVLLLAILSLKPKACSRQASERRVKREEDPHALEAVFDSDSAPGGLALRGRAHGVPPFRD